MPEPRSAIFERVIYKSARVGIPGPSGPQGPTGATGPGVPVGGTTGQYAVKASDGDFDIEWYTLDAAGVPDLPTSKITSGVFDVARIPDLEASKITSGTFDTARIPNLPISHIASLQAALDALQPLDADLAAIAGLTPSASDFLQFVSSAWANRTPTQVKASLAIATGDVSGLGTIATQNANAVAITGGSAAFTATLSNTLSDAVTNAVSTVLTLGHNSSGTPAAGFGSRILLQLESNTTENRDAAAIDTRWTNPADATSTAALDFYIRVNGVLTNIAVLSSTNLNIAASIRPSATTTYDLGTAAARWASVYSSQFVMDPSSAHIIADGGASGGLISYTTSSDTNAATRPLWIFVHRGGTPAAGFGGRIATQLESSTTNDVNASAQETSWVVATHASRTARVRHLVYDTTEREYMRGEASGSAPMIGFLGASAIVRVNLGTWGSMTMQQQIDALRDALSNLGLASYS